MKNLKKAIAALAAATMVTSCAGVVASADEAVNAVNVSYSTVAETFTAADGTVIPAGATAVTLSIENNTGFSASDITLNATADLLGTNGLVTATNGSAYGDAIVSAAQNGSKVVITSASLDDSKNDGTLVTFYTTSDAEVTVEDASFESVKNNEISCYTSHQYDFYVIGDLNSDEQVNSKDAAIMLSAYNIAEADGSLLTTANGKALMVSIAKMNPAKYKLDSAKKVEAADGNKDGRIMNCDDVNYSDVKQLLNYAAATGAGLTYDVAGWHYGEYVGYVK